MAAMTIKQLTELLQNFPEDYKVVIEVMGVEDDLNAIQHRPRLGEVVLCRE